jgi:multidrug/hemolysin transport system ATP-binding protein
MLPRLYGQLSGGQKRRCDIARALLPDPAVLLLDEPCTGLDAAARSAVWDAVARIRREERTTILLSTHDMDEAGRADSVLILNEGKIAAAGTPAELRSAFARDSLVLFSNDFARLAGNLAAAGIPYRTEKGGARIVLRESLGALPILEWCRGSYTGFEVRRGTLETAYLTVLEGDGGHADVCAALYRTVCSGQGRGVPVLSD